jgi:hypothetical protein
MTPQEKRLSYQRDRRNTYGENDKSSRRNVHRRKRMVNRANRQQESAVLTAVRGLVIESVADAAGERIARTRRKTFRKYPDEPLGAVVRRQLRHRGELDETALPVQTTRIQRVDRHNHTRAETGAEIGPWVGMLTMLDARIRREPPDPAAPQPCGSRRWVPRRLSTVQAAARAGAFSPAEVAAHYARFAAGLYRDDLVSHVADLLPDPDTLVRACLDQVPMTIGEFRRAAMPGDARRRAAKRLIEAAAALAPHLADHALAASQRTWQHALD